MALQGVLLDEKFGELVTLQKPLSFHCTVRGKKLKAKVIAEVKNPINFIYRVEFSDGYVSDFYSGEFSWRDSANDPEDGGPTKNIPYAKAIQQDLEAICSIMSGERYYAFNTPIKNEKTNVYVAYREYEDKEPSYVVYYHGEYQFNLQQTKKGEWEAFDVRVVDKRKLDHTLVRNICLLIESKEDKL